VLLSRSNSFALLFELIGEKQHGGSCHTNGGLSCTLPSIRCCCSSKNLPCRARSITRTQRGRSTSKHRKSSYDGWGDERECGEGVEGSGAAPRERTLEHIFPNVSQSYCENNLLQLLHATLFWSFALEPYELGINPSLYNANLNIS